MLTSFARLWSDFNAWRTSDKLVSFPLNRTLWFTTIKSMERVFNIIEGIQDFQLCNKQWRTQEFCSGRGVQQLQLRTEDSENGDLGAVAPYSEVLEAAVIWYKKLQLTW